MLRLLMSKTTVIFTKLCGVVFLYIPNFFSDAALLSNSNPDLTKATHDDKRLLSPSKSSDDTFIRKGAHQIKSSEQSYA